MAVFTCEVCGRDSAYLVKRPFDSLYNQIPIRLDAVEMYECQRCGECTLTPEQDQAISEKVKGLARERLDLLPPEAITSIRKRCQISPAELERLFGLGKNSVVQWEQGRVLPSKTADVLLRLLDRNPGIVDELRQIHS